MYLTAIILTAVGALNWGFIALFDVNLVSLFFGVDTLLTNAVYLIVGLSALYLVIAYSYRSNERSKHRGHSNRPATAHR